MSCIHFKFSNTVENEKLKFDGLQISVSDLRDAIIKLKNLKANLYTLKIIDAQTKEVYSDDSKMLARNTSVVVSRIPLSSALKAPKSKFKETSMNQSEPVLPGLSSVRTSSIGPKSLSGDNSVLSAEELMQTADLANANASEADKVKAMMRQSTETYDQSQYVWTPGRSSGAGGLHTGLKKNPPPPTYVCYRCGNRGHWIQMCPTNGDPNFNPGLNSYRYKSSRGTPSSQLVSVTENVQGAMVDHNGQLVVRAVDLAAVEMAKQKKLKRHPVFEEPKKDDKPPVELICSLCNELMKEAVIIPCCGESFCSECIWTHLCDNDFTCPACKKEEVSPDNLAPNKRLRQSAKNFLSKAAEEKSVAVASSTGYVKKAPIVVPPKPPSTSSVTAGTSSSSSVVKKAVYNPITKPITVSPNKQSVAVTSSTVVPVVKKEDKQNQSEPKNQPVVRSILPSVVKTESSSKSKSPSRGPTPPVVEAKNPVSSAPVEPEALRPPVAAVKSKSPPAVAAVEARKSPQPKTEESRDSPKPMGAVAVGGPDNVVKKITDDRKAANGTTANGTEEVTEVAVSAGATVEKLTGVAGSGDAKVADKAIKAESGVGRSSTTSEKELEVVKEGATTVVNVIGSPLTEKSNEGKAVLDLPALAAVSLGAAPAGITFLSSKPAVPLTTAVPQMPSVLGQPPPFHLLPGSSSLGGLSGTTGVIGDSLGGFGTRSHHQSSGDPSKLDKLAAELLLTSAVSKKKAPSPPLSIEEFYRHKKLLKRITKDKVGRRSESHSSRSYSQSSSMDSSSSYSSDSYSHSSSSSSSYSRSRSRSPVYGSRKGGVVTAARHSHKHKHERSHKHNRVAKEEKKRSRARKEKRDRRVKELVREEKKSRRGGSRDTRKHKEDRSKQHRHSHHRNQGVVAKTAERKYKEEKLASRRRNRRKHRSTSKSPEEERKALDTGENKIAADEDTNMKEEDGSPSLDQSQVSPVHNKGGGDSLEGDEQTKEKTAKVEESAVEKNTGSDNQEKSEELRESEEDENLDGVVEVNLGVEEMSSLIGSAEREEEKKEEVVASSESQDTSSEPMEKLHGGAKEDGELSDSEEDSKKSTNLQVALSLVKTEAPDLRETINSQKINRKRPALVDNLEIVVGNGEIAASPSKRSKILPPEEKNIASSTTTQPVFHLSGSEEGGFTADDSRSSEDSPDEEENLQVVKKSKVKLVSKKHHSSSSAKKHRKMRERDEGGLKKNKRTQESSHNRRHRSLEENQEKKRRKEKKHKHNSKEHKHSSSHKSAKKSSHVDKAEKKKLKKHKKSSAHSERSRHVH